MSRTWIVSASVIACLALAGCSSAAPAPASRSTTAPAASAAPASSAAASASASASTAPAASGARTITGTGYRYSVPKGWAVPKSDVGTSTDSLAADLTDKDGFSDNVNVVVVDTGAIPLDALESQAGQQLKGAGFGKVSVRDRTTVGGVESPHVTALQTAGTYRIDQFYVLRSGKGYIVTFSFSPSVSQSKRDAVTGRTLASWSWA